MIVGLLVWEFPGQFKDSLGILKILKSVHGFMEILEDSFEVSPLLTVSTDKSCYCFDCGTFANFFMVGICSGRR